MIARQWQTSRRHPRRGQQARAAIEARDLLADLSTQLRKLTPRCGEYRTMTGAKLGDLLGNAVVRVTNAGNVPTLDLAGPRVALADRGPG